MNVRAALGSALVTVLLTGCAAGQEQEDTAVAHAPASTSPSHGPVATRAGPARAGGPPHGRRLPGALRRRAPPRRAVVRRGLVRSGRRVRGLQHPPRADVALGPTGRRPARRPLAAEWGRRHRAGARPRGRHHGAAGLDRLRRPVPHAALAGRTGPDRLPVSSSRHFRSDHGHRCRHRPVRRRHRARRRPDAQRPRCAAGPVRALPRAHRGGLRHRALLLAPAARRAGDVDPLEQPVRAVWGRPVRDLRPRRRLRRGQHPHDRERPSRGDRCRARARRRPRPRPRGAGDAPPVHGRARPLVAVMVGFTVGGLALLLSS